MKQTCALASRAAVPAALQSVAMRPGDAIRAVPSDAAQLGFRLGTVERFRSLGHRATKDHVQLFGHVPHIAPQAWLHAVPPGLNGAELADLVRRVGRPFRPEFLNFLLAMNGVKLFSGALCLYGARPPMAGRGIDAAFLPFDLVDPNGVERPRRLEEQLLVIGGYREDGSLITLDFASGEVSRCSRDTGIRFIAWPSFADFVRDELTRLDCIHDDQGRATAEHAHEGRARQ